MNKNLVSLGLLRNGKIYQNKHSAIQGLIQTATNDGVAKLARYLDEVNGVEIVRTVVGFYADASEITGAENAQSSYTILDVDGSASDIDELKEAVAAINDKIGEGIDGTTLTAAINDINDRLGDGFTSDHTVADALSELETALENKLTISLEVAETPTSGYLKTYVLSQGVDAEKVEIGKIDIPKDMVVSGGSLVHGTWDGNTFVEDPEGTDTAIKIEFANADTIYINTKDLVDFYTAGDGISVDNDHNVISINYNDESEEFLVVDADGIKVQGIQAAIDAKADEERLIASDGISILDNNKIKAVAAKFSADGVDNPISIVEDGIVFTTALNCGFFDYETAVPQNAADIAAITDPETTDLVIESNNAIGGLSLNNTYNSVALDGVSSNTSFGVSAKSIKINDAEFGGGKDTSNGKVNFAAPSVDINGVTVAEGSTMYNLFEGNQTGVANKEFTASNVVVNDPQMKHNVFNIYSPDNNAEILVKDSSFNLSVDNSNAMRLANYKNSTGVTVTFEDVDWTYENSVAATDWSWAGLVIYQPANTDVALGGDTSKFATWKFKFKNCRYNGVKVDAVNFGERNQVIYGYNIGNTGAVSDISSIVTVEFE